MKQNEFETITQDDTRNKYLPWNDTAILLVDLDAFFASVEQLDHPEWRNKPVIVGGDPEKRGVVSTASYEARKFGVHSAMPSRLAAQLCPHAFWTNGHFNRYKEMSKSVMDILYEESPRLMQVSIDEAFLDITPTRINTEHPVNIAYRIQRRVSELGITCSIGLGTSKSVAKIASNIKKPNGITVVYPGKEKDFLFPLPIKEMSGIGKVAEKKLHAFHIKTLGDLAKADHSILKNVFGKNAEMMRERACGIDTPVQETEDSFKSISNELSLAISTNSKDEINSLITSLAHKVGRRLRKNKTEGQVLHLKIKFENLTQRTCQRKIPDLSSNELMWIPFLNEMLDELWDGKELIRLVGVGISNFKKDPCQTSLFNEENEGEKTNLSSLDKKKGDALLQTSDAIAQKFGDAILSFGSTFKTKESNTGSSAKNPEDYKN